MFTPSRQNRESAYFNEENPFGGESIIFPTLKALRTSDPIPMRLVESPAKVFARMKARVQTERRPVENEGTKTPKFVQEKLVREKHGRVMSSPRKSHQPWVNYEQKENEDLAFTNEAEALTLSPGQSPRKGLTHPYFMVHKQDLQRPSPKKDMGSAFKPTNRNTPIKGPSLAVISVAQSPTKALSHPKESQTFDFTDEAEALTLSPVQSPRKSLTHTHFVHTQDFQIPSPLKDMRSAFKPTNRNTQKKGLTLDAFSTQSPRKALSYLYTQLSSNDIQQPTPPKDFKRAFQTTDRTPPVKRSTQRSKSTEDCNGKTAFGAHDIVQDPSVFKRRQKRDQKDGYQVSSPQDPMNGGCARVRSMSTPAHVTGGNEADASVNVTCGVAAVPSSLSDTSVPSSPESDPSQCGYYCDKPPLRPFPDMVHDPLLQVSPKISIPKKRVAVFQSKQIAESNAISLRHWILKSRSGSLYVEGFRVDNKMLWHSNIIAERMSSNVLKTTTGSTYVLVGKMAPDLSGTHAFFLFLCLSPRQELPTWLLKKFLFGFPKNWKEYLECFLSEPKGSEADNSKGPKGSKDLVTPQNQNHLFTKKQSSTSLKLKATKRPAPCSATSEASSAKVSRSGRLLKTPLEYWKGARVILDCDMNVTIHGGYDESSILQSTISTPVARVLSLLPPKPPKVFLPPAEERLGADTSEEEAVPLRKVTAYQRSKPEKNPSPKPPRCKAEDNPPHRGHGIPKKTSPNFQWSKPENLSTRGPGKPKRASPASLRSKSEVTPKHLGEPRKTSLRSQSAAALAAYTDPAPQSLSPPCRSLQGANKQSSQDNSDNTNTSSELLPGKPIKGSDKANRKVLEMPKKRVSCQKELPAKLHDDIEMEGKDTGSCAPTKTGSAAIGRSWNVQDSGSGTAEESQSDDHFTPKKRPKAKSFKSGSIKPWGMRTCGRVLEGSESATSHWSTSPDDCKRELTKRAGPQRPRQKGGKFTRVQQEKKEENADQWTEVELQRLHEAVTSFPKHINNFWVNVAMVVGTRSAEECQEQYNAQASIKSTKKKEVPQKKELLMEPPRITARKGTLKRKQQVRNLLDHMPKDDHDDIFNSSPMQDKWVKLPTVSPNGKEDVFMRSEQDPQTPSSSGFPSVKTPQCLHITPGMMGSVNRGDNDKYVYQLQKRMKKSQAKLHKLGAASKYMPTPSAKHALKRCSIAENNSSFVVWEMFPDKEDHSVESGEEGDYYFMDDD
uniref:Myb-like domain-containing protein n=1 Tax=Hucho hucho TaxID=62062 RepID=A0A4W5RFK9_9TELE